MIDIVAVLAIFSYVAVMVVGLVMFVAIATFLMMRSESRNADEKVLASAQERSQKSAARRF